jgi:L-alanine-DL-glutamate epimerase-like enolase superfamily enzyme
MKITSVKAIPGSHTTTRAGISVSRNYVFVKIETDDGLTG